mmetsp:Transcript_39042/g.79836  ORF Transcript_39042/g.79836 Transcript_39042/m.79836 type:complete len:543 (+) Transcript_39042:106-1734(+)
MLNQTCMICSASPADLKLGCWLQALVGLHGEVVHGEWHDVVSQVGGDHVLLSDGWDVWCASQAHDHLQLVLQHVDHAHDAVLAVRGQGVQDRTAHTAGLRTQSNCLEDVATTTDTSINENGKVLLGSACLLQGFHDLRQHLNARTAGVELTSTVVGQDAASQTSLEGLNGILSTLHTLQEHLHGGNLLEPWHVLPVEARVNVAADGTSGSLGTVHCAFILIITLHIGALLSELVAHVLLTTSQLRSIHGHEQCLDACLLKLGDVLLRSGPLRIHVELREHHLVRSPSFQHLVQGVGAQSWQHVGHPRLLGGLHNGQFSLLVGQLGQSRCGEVQWQGRGDVQDLRCHVNFADVHQDARTHGDPLESQVVVTQSDLIIASTGVVAPGLGLHDLAGHRLEVEAVQHGSQRRLLELLDLLLGSVSLHCLLLWLGLVGLRRLGHMLRLDASSIHHSHGQGWLQELVHDVLGMDGIEDGGGIHPSSVRDELGASGMDLGELGQVVGLAIEHNPAILLGVVLGNLFSANRHGRADGRSGARTETRSKGS